LKISFYPAAGFAMPDSFDGGLFEVDTDTMASKLLKS
jgi:hypothetical protein